jgi:hypothetical protein
MTLLDPTYIRDSVDYSFGDQSGAFLPYGYMKEANINNSEFIDKLNSIQNSGRKIMTLFIDNIRLYYRDNAKLTAIELYNESAKYFKYARIREFSNNDLLNLCSQFKTINFIIFTGFEDTPIDDVIFDRIPENVLGIYASNCISFGGKVNPIPYGIQRKLNPSDNRHNILSRCVNIDVVPQKKLYINHSLGSNPARIEINDFYSTKPWVTLSSPIDIGDSYYETYLMEIKNHKFMICPDGNAIGCECHRDWEVLYMRRVPIVKRTKYLEKIFEGIPVLFVDSFLGITEKLLEDNEHLYEEMKTFDLSKLDMSVIYKNILNNYDFSIT